VRIGLAQINTTVGDIDGNCRLIQQYARRALDAGCALLVTPELAITGYPPQDLLLLPHFIREQRAAFDTLAVELPLPALIGFVDSDAEGSIYNSAALVVSGGVVKIIHKTLLPTYDVFDELRYFKPSSRLDVMEFAGVRLGVSICEDLWDEDYADKVLPGLKRAGAQLMVNLSASPYHRGKGHEREELLRRHATENELPILYCNLFGGQDELIFDGGSLAVSAAGELAGAAGQFHDALLVVDFDPHTGALSALEPELPEPAHGTPEEVFTALSAGVEDYFRKCGFTRAVIGLSGGIDSALTACIAVDALQPQQVIGVAMPGPYSSPISLQDARSLAEALGIEFRVMDINPSVELAQQRFRAEFGDYQHNLTLENLQARERGKILMEISNDRGALVLSTGNKTEYALGYTTLYGDMCGGLAVIGDISKPEVYELSRDYNLRRGTEVIPERTLTRPPSAELREGQVDPFDYERIGPLADAVIEEHLSEDQLIERGYTIEEVQLVMQLVRVSEYKRWQAPPILRVSRKAFGIGRRMPIVNHYKG
jgi:NAD+ synthase (glutamine-hydrolysing)